MKSATRQTSRFHLRWLYLAIGLACLGLAIAGAFLPVLPTTPLALLAAWAFGRSSPRFEAWLVRHRRLGPPIREWRAHRVIPLRAKRTAWAAMALSIVVSVASGKVPSWALAVQLILMGYGAWFIARCPSKASRADPEAVSVTGRRGACESG